MARAARTRGRARVAAVSYVGYSLKEPPGEPRAVIGIDADEAEYLDISRSSSTAMNAPQRVQIPQQQVRRAELPPESTGEHARAALLGAPASFGVGRHAQDQARDVATGLAAGLPVSLPASSLRGRRARRRLLTSRLPALSLRS